MEKEEEKEDNKKKIVKLLKPYYKVLCNQISIITILVLLYCNYYNYSDTLIYLIFGAFISILINAFILLIKKYKICTSIEFTKKYSNNIFKLYEKYTNFNE